VAELLEGKRIDYPPTRDVNVTYKRPQRAKRASAKNADLFDAE